ncbi:hypothetical protein B0H14DRAFT_2802415 [Mycena olivaceomarginata]|nr:hypothetical protein B0H14DRAFT_2802415 [Mycena olivaceomarginata]
MSPSAHLVSGLPSTALIVIDVQQAFNDPYYLNRERSTPNLEPNITLLAAFRAQGLPIIHIHHVNTKNDSSLWYEATRPTGVLPMEYVAPKDDELVLRKYNKSSAFGAFLVSDGTTSLAKCLMREDQDRDSCRDILRSRTGRSLSSGTRQQHTLRMLWNFGGAKGDGRDGISWGAETAHAVSMAQLQGEFADVVTTTEVLKYL